MDGEVWIERGKGRTLSVNVRFFTDKIAKGGSGYVKPGHAWFQGDVAFRANEAHGIRSIGPDPIMFNHPDDLFDAIVKAAEKQGITLLEPKTRAPLTRDGRR